MRVLDAWRNFWENGRICAVNSGWGGEQGCAKLGEYSKSKLEIETRKKWGAETRNSKGGKPRNFEEFETRTRNFF
jgi:hypothetical protein